MKPNLLLLMVLFVPPAAAQSIPTSTGVAFEVASVKSSPRPEPNPFGFPVGAYDIQDVRITSGPDWMTRNRYDVVAVARSSTTADDTGMQQMLRSLLSDRFQLRVHTESRDMPVYDLVVARRDPSPGPQLRKSLFDCASLRLKRGPGGTAPPDGSEPSCQISFRVSGGNMTIGFQGETSSELARHVIPERDRPIVDKTGLTGTFDGELTFAPEPLPGFPRLPGSENGVSVFTALQEQWGLKLEPARGPVEVLVIESAQPPTEN
jgi:uncharacterized protein (TIGR03435 family)